jgi:hypothetical protein
MGRLKAGMAGKVARLAAPLLVVLLSGCALARAGTLDDAREAAAKGECAKAVSNAQRAGSYGTPSSGQAAEILFIRAYCAQRMGDESGATGLYRYLKDHYPETPYGYQATEWLRANAPDDGAPASPKPAEIPK